MTVNGKTRVRRAREFPKAKVSEQLLKKFVLYTLSSQIYNELYDQIKAIYPAKKIEIRSSEIFELTKEVRRAKKEEETEADVA
ncbi:MAG: hypothetical protein LVQ63_00520 [Thermoplasmatales archaeon]|nr:hypothetical protein [Thermoplasmatales archaeon]